MVWLQVNLAAWRLPPAYASAPLLFPSRCGSCPVAHPKVILMQLLAKHIEQLVALTDELHETTIRGFKRLCDKCGCHNKRELAAYLAEERQPLACQLACFLRLCGQMVVPVMLPACTSLAVAGLDVSWYAWQMHLQAAAAAADARAQLADVAIVAQSLLVIWRRFRSKGVCCPRQLIIETRASPENTCYPSGGSNQVIAQHTKKLQEQISIPGYVTFFQGWNPIGSDLTL